MLFLWLAPEYQLLPVFPISDHPVNTHSKIIILKIILGTGLYNNLQKFNLPNPHAIFEIGYFKKNPQPFFALAKELFHENIKVKNDLIVSLKS